MGRREKPQAKSIPEEDDYTTASKVYSDSDDAAANEDLTLKINAKAIARASNVPAAGDGVDNVTSVVNGVVVEEFVEKKKVKKVKKKKAKKVEAEIVTAVTVAEVEQLQDAVKDANVVNLSDSSAMENSNADNVVLKSLLRGPRYFDPPDRSWGACFNCGEEGHSAVNCTSARRKKPCFICGSLEHEVKQCQKGQDCFICKGQGHRAKDCPQKMKRCSSASEFCLKCGAAAHVMFSCNNDYFPDDLKDLQCYVCKRFGHICCANYFKALASEASCYKCGQTGHLGQECRGSRGETSTGGTPGTPSSCFKCGEDGHFARDCKTSGKRKKRTNDSSTLAEMNHSKHNKGSKGHKSAPQDFGNNRKKKMHLNDESPKWSSKPKRRGGWIPDDSDDFLSRNGWRSPMTPNKNYHKIFDLTTGGQGSSPYKHSKKKDNFHPGSSNQHRRFGRADDFKQRFTRREERDASRWAGHRSMNERSGTGRNYDGW